MARRQKPIPASEPMPDHPADFARRAMAARGWGIVMLGMGLASVLATSVWLLREHNHRNVGNQNRRVVDGSGIGRQASDSLDTETDNANALSVVSLETPDRAATAVEQLAGKQATDQDDWDTEAISEAAIAQLQILQEVLANSPFDVESLSSLVTADVASTPLRPTELRKVDDIGPISFHRADPKTLITASSPRSTGPQQFAEHLAAIVTSLGPGNDPHYKFKLFRIDQDGASATSLVRFEASNQNAEGSIQQTATWRCEWQLDESADVGPRLHNVQVTEFEEVVCRQPGGRLFVDCTASALGKNPAYEQQIILGINQWLDRISREFLGQFGHHGLAIGDVNGDELDDLYFCDAGGLPNRLFVHQPDGTLQDVSAEAGVDLLEDSIGTLLIDLDNDGDQDLVVGTDPVLQIAENDGTGKFQWRTRIEINTDAFSITAADYDRDGDLDIYVCGYNVRKQDPSNRGLPFPVPYHDANNGGRNLLLKNEGGFQFTDVTRDVGLEQNNSRFSMAAAWEDFDNDGDQDLYVANDFGRNNLFRNDGGRFVDIAASCAVEDHGSGMSVSWGDYDRDGQMDLYVGNMFSAAGNRVTYQRRFASGRSDATIGHLQRMARGNTLFRNVSDAQHDGFVDMTEEAAVGMGRWAWGSKFVDLTNDGWLDLVVANGYVTNEVEDDL